MKKGVTCPVFASVALGMAVATPARAVEIKAGENKLDFTIKFDLKTDGASAAAAGATSPATPKK